MKHLKTLFKATNRYFGKLNIGVKCFLLILLAIFLTVTVDVNEAYAEGASGETLYAVSPLLQQMKLSQPVPVVPGGSGYMLPQTVVAKDAAGNPLSGVLVTFEVTSNDKVTAIMRGYKSASIQVTTDANGMASAANTYSSYLGEGYQVYSKYAGVIVTLQVKATVAGWNSVTFDVQVGTDGSNMIDNTNPFISVSAKDDTGATYVAGSWTNHSVNVSYSAKDTLSAITSCTPNQLFDVDGANQSATGTAEDSSHNVASVSFGPINIDKSAPVTTATVTNPDTWNNGTVTLEINSADSVSGVAAIYYKIGSDSAVKTDGDSFTTNIDTEGIKEISYWAQDNAGNIEQPKSITVKIDKTAPIITSQLSTEKNENGWNNSNVSVMLKATDLYSGVSKIYYKIGETGVEQTVIGDAASIPVNTEGITAITFWAVDNMGFATEKEVIEVKIDKTNPLITVPEDISLEATAVNTPVQIGTAKTEDISDIKLTNDAPEGGFPVGVTKVKWKAIDSAGFFAEAVQTITVEDTTKPLLTVQGNIVKEATGILTQTTVGPADAKDIFSVNITNDAPAAGFPIGDTKVTFTATDANGNSVSAVQYVTIKDRIAPVLTLPANITAREATGVRTSIDIATATAKDIFDVTVENNAPVDFTVGTTEVTWKATDANGNVSTGIQKVTVVDTTKPELTIPEDITIEATARRMKLYIGEAIATDIFAVTVTNDAPADFGVGTTKVTWTATDANGNITAKVQNVTVTDKTKPVIKIPEDITFEATGRTTLVQTGLPEVSDIFETNTTNNAPTNNTFPLGSTTVTWTVTDSNGNVSTGIQIINVVDTTKPLLTLPQNLNVEATAIKTPVTIGIATATDIFNVTVKNDAPVDYPIGITKVTWTATDENGNVTTGVQEITIVDTTKPVISITGNTDVEATGRRTPVTFKATATDIFIVTITDDALADYPLGISKVTVTATDENGNVGTAEVTIIVTDKTQPLIVLPVDMTVEANAVRSIIDIGNPEVSDIFDVTVVSDAPADYPLGLTKVHWTATDENGNVSTGTQNITVKDTTKPELMVPEDITAEATAVLSPIALGKATATDIFDVTIKNNAPEGFPLGQTVITWTATDKNGNVSTATQRITVKDTTAPALISVEDLTVEATDILSPVDIGGPEVYDIFRISIIKSDAPTAFPLGTTKVLWEIIDENGNSTTAIQSITVVDTTKPVLNLPANLTLEATAVRTPVDLIKATASDIFGVDVISDAPADFPIGTTTITWKATDKNGNVATGTQNVTIVDTTKPELVVPTAITKEATAVRTPVDIGIANANDIFIVTITNDAPADYPIGTTTVTWTATDENGNVSTAQQLVTIVDTTKPELIVPESIITEAIAINTIVNIGEATASDIFKVTVTNDAPADYKLGKTTVTWTATDENGNVSTAEQVITIVDTTKPELVVPEAMTVEATAVRTPVAIGEATASDIFNVTITNDVPVNYPIGKTVVRWTAIDENGNVSTAEQVITIVDTTKPNLIVPEAIITEATAVRTLINIREATATDIFKVTIKNDAPVDYPVGKTIVTWTATDENGNVSTAEQTITILDTTKPVLVIPNAITTEATAIRTPVAIGEATATDIFNVELKNNAPADYPIGTTTVTWTATDANGNVSIADQVITIVDTTKPELVIPNNKTEEAIGIETPVSIGGATASDIFKVTVTNDAPVNYALGDTKVTWKAVDENGNTSTAEQLITIVDTTIPELTVPVDVTAEATAIATPVSIGEATASDIFEVTVTNNAPADYALGTKIVTWTATDANGNVATKEQLVTIVDTTPSELIPPEAVTAEATALKTPVKLGSPITRDIYDVTVSNDAPADGFQLGTKLVKWTATDANGNVSTAEQKVTLIDTTKPKIVAPMDITTEATAVRTSVSIGSPTTSDIYKVTTKNDAPIDGFQIGTTVVTWTATDENGNVSTAQQLIIITDTTRPELIVPVDVTADATAIETPVSIGEATASDIFKVTVTNDAPADYPIGTTVVTWTATDENGNVTRAEQNITIVHVCRPMLILPANIEVEATAVRTPVNIGQASATDIFKVTITNDAPVDYPIGTTEVKWTATDEGGNVSTAEQIVTVVDTTKPELVVPADVTAEATAVRTQVNIGQATATDIFKVTITNDAPADYPIGTTIVTWTATDENGNVTIVQQKITIVDTTKPELVVPADVTAEATAIATQVNIGQATATDIFKVTITSDAPADYPIGTTIVTWTATDENGNVTTVEQKVTIVDTTKPELIVPGDITTEATAVRTPVDIGEATPSDIFKMTVTNDAPADYPIGTTVVTWTIIDENGNVKTVEQRITIVDTTKPELVVPADVTAEATAIGTQVNIGQATATDIFIVAITSDAPADYPIGTTIVTWTATDENGNVTTGAQNVTVVDTTAPVLKVPKAVIAEATALRTPVNIGQATGIDIFNVTITKDGPADYPIGTTKVVWIATDANGNVITGLQDVIVKDTKLPVINIPADITVTATGIRTVVSIGTATATDIFSVDITNDAPVDFPVGNTMVTWTAKDLNGNISTAVQNIFVNAVQKTIAVKSYNSTRSNISNTIDPRIMLENISNTTINLSDIKIRYYYTVDGDKGQAFWCDYAEVSESNSQRNITSNVTGAVQKSSVKVGSDYYIEISFSSTAGSLKPGEKVVIQGRLSKTDWSNYTQSNDYSFNSTATNYTENSKITVYSFGNLIVGVEP